MEVTNGLVGCRGSVIVDLLFVTPIACGSSVFGLLLLFSTCVLCTCWGRDSWLLYFYCLSDDL